MIEGHCSEEALISVIVGSEVSEQWEEIELHCTLCPKCAGELRALRAFADELSDPQMWKSIDAPSLRVEPDPELLRATSEQIAAQEQEAIRLLGDPAMLLSDLPRTAGTARILLARGRQRIESDGENALRDCELAVAITHELIVQGNDPLLIELCVSAHRDLSNALSAIGRFDAALAQLDLADRTLATTAASAYQHACLDHVRAMILWRQQRRSDARRLAERCSDTFVLFGDRRRHAQSQMLLAGISFEEGDAFEARELFFQQIAPLQQLGDLRNLSMVYNNIAHCSVLLDEQDVAANYFTQALRLFDDLQLIVMRANAQWNLARIRVRGGRVVEAMERFEAAEAAFASRQMTREALLVAMERFELQLASGDSRGLTLRCRQLIDELLSHHSAPNEREAVEYLLECQRDRQLDAADVRAVRHFIERLGEVPAARFVPPLRR